MYEKSSSESASKICNEPSPQAKMSFAYNKWPAFFFVKSFSSKFSSLSQVIASKCNVILNIGDDSSTCAILFILSI